MKLELQAVCCELSRSKQFGKKSLSFYQKNPFYNFILTWNEKLLTFVQLGFWQAPQGFLVVIVNRTYRCLITYSHSSEWHLYGYVVTMWSVTLIQWHTGGFQSLHCSSDFLLPFFFWFFCFWFWFDFLINESVFCDVLFHLISQKIQAQLSHIYFYLKWLSSKNNFTTTHFLILTISIIVWSLRETIYDRTFCLHQ